MRAVRNNNFGAFVIAVSFVIFLYQQKPGKFAVCACRRGGTALQIGMGLMLGGALANLIERWARGSVTDYVYLPRAVIPFFRRIIWNAADLSILTGCTTAVIALLCEEL